MFTCIHDGRCCEDPATQISLTLGDVQRLCKATKKTALQLYQENIIGIQPFGDPNNPQKYETEIGLYIPCQFREFDEKKGKKVCAVYEERPINCRLFPYWILSDAPVNEIKKIAKESCKCLQEMDFSDFKEERKIYFDYKEKIVKILFEETKVTDNWYKKCGIKKTITVSENSNTIEDDRKIITKLVEDLKKQDFSKEFRKLDEELTKHSFTKANDLPTVEESEKLYPIKVSQ